MECFWHLKSYLGEKSIFQNGSLQLTPFPDFIIWHGFQWNLPKDINPLSCFNACFLDGYYLFFCYVVRFPGHIKVGGYMVDAN